MTILYSCIARGVTLLVENSASYEHNFSSVCRSMLQNIPYKDSKVVYTSDQYMFPVIVRNGITYLCAASQDFSKKKSYAFLDEIIRRVTTSSLDQRVQHAGEHELDRDLSIVLSQEMDHYSHLKESPSNIDNPHSQVDEVKGNIDELMQKTEDLEASGTPGLLPDSISLEPFDRMTILYCCIARGATLLVERSASGDHNFSSVCRPMLRRISFKSDSETSYPSDEYEYMVIVRKNIAYICVASREDFSTAKSFDFLKEIIEYVTTNRLEQRLQDAGEHELDSDLNPVLERKMDFFSDIRNQQLWKQKYEMKDLVVKAINHLIEEPDIETTTFLQETAEEFEMCKPKKKSKCGKRCKICCTIM